MALRRSRLRATFQATSAGGLSVVVVVELPVVVSLVGGAPCDRRHSEREGSALLKGFDAYFVT